MSKFSHLMVPSFCGSFILWFLHFVVPSFCGSLILWFPHFVVPSFCGSLILWFPHFVVPSFCGSLILWFPQIAFNSYQEYKVGRQLTSGDVVLAQVETRGCLLQDIPHTSVAHT